MKSENKMEKKDTVILLIHCPDQRGLIAAVTEFITKNQGNIVYLDQYVDPIHQEFFMRIEWELENFLIPREKIGEYFNTLLAQRFHMKWKLYFSRQTPRMAIFVSKLPHCLFDILSRWRSGEFRVEIPVIISNHLDLKPIAEQFNILFYHFPITRENKAHQEAQELDLLNSLNIDLIVLARYMQILTPEFVSQYPNRIINIHHSFLPAFPGARPYHSAYERGVKVIGATSHYVTAELDQGPIIEQDVVRVSHTDTVQDFIRKGRDLEKVVLSRAIWWHLQRKTLVYENKTIVFT